MTSLRTGAIAFALLPIALQVAHAQTPESSVAKLIGATCDRASFRVILDVGHTIEAPGAISARGVTEYEFNLNLAKQIERALTSAGFARTEVLVTPGLAKPAMYKRVAHVKETPADLLLSIHHDAVPNSFLEKWEYEGKPANYSDRFRGHSIFVAYGNGDHKASLEFAKLLGHQLKDRGLHYAPHYTEAFMGRFRHELLDKDVGVYRYDALFVLKTPRIPAVLFEAGSIVNRNEELLVGTPEYQAVIGASVTEAVESFCASRALQVAQKPAHKLASAPRIRRHARSQNYSAAAE